ncbi:TetR/AcrR family transcriptional regulator [Nocardioides fonticola]|uniref:TetR/AcrR family transcriptional regulator n=1 Tax=Nocardioides fonticola TaxID=450363 RepID=A0ABP7XGX0_9ACTN
MKISLVDLLAGAATVPPVDLADPVVTRLLDAALAESATVGLRRLTMDDIARRAGVGRMTAYRRFAKRDDLVHTLVAREALAFLTAINEATEKAETLEEISVETFTAATGFVRRNPLLRLVADTDPGSFVEVVGAQGARILRLGTEFLARQIHGDDPGEPTAHETAVAEVCARLFTTYVAIPLSVIDPDDEDAVRRYAREVIAPIAATGRRPPVSAVGSE